MAGIIILIVAWTMALADLQPPLRTSLSVVSDGSERDSVVMLQYTLLNPSSITRYALVWDTPLERRLTSSQFNISSAVKWKYIGLIAKRHSRVPLADFVTLPAGESVSTLVNLSSYYAFASAGNISVRAVHSLHEATLLQHEGAVNGELTLSELRRQKLISNAVSVRVTSQQFNASLVDARRSVHASQFDTTPSMLLAQAIGCNAHQQQAFSTTRGNALTMARQAQRELSPAADQRNYLRWFGSQRHKGVVQSHFDKVVSRLTSQDYRLTCMCPDAPASGVFAYVFPADSTHTIHLCRYFFSPYSPLMYGRDSRPGTFIHEMTHFMDIGDTDDIEYGFEACEQLARTNSAVTLRNADSHEYYAENVLNKIAGKELEPKCDRKPVAPVCDHTCSEHLRGPVTCMANVCVCRPGYCTAPNGWHCELAGSKEAKEPDTIDKPVGRCLARLGPFGISTWCWPSHGPTWCVEGKCVCQPGYSTKDGYHCEESVQDDNVPMGNFTHPHQRRRHGEIIDLSMLARSVEDLPQRAGVAALVVGAIAGGVLMLSRCRRRNPRDARSSPLLLG